jgi:hypothetical protein
MNSWKVLVGVVVGLLAGLIVHELIGPAPVAAQHKVQDYLLDYEQQVMLREAAERGSVGTQQTAAGAQAIMETEIAVSGDIVYIVQNGKVFRSTEKGEPGSWEPVLY